MEPGLHESAARVKARSFRFGSMLVVAVAVVLRFVALDGEFLWEDDLRLTVQILGNAGYEWISWWQTGVLQPLIQKISMATISELGWPTTVFWWRASSAAMGVVHIAVVVAFAGRLGWSRDAALASGLLLAVSPVHVANSRYTWGHEICGVLFLTLAMSSLLRFYERPGSHRAALASLACAMYSISHHYIFPFAVVIVGMAIAACPPQAMVLHHVGRSVWAFLRYGVWIVPLAFFPLYVSSFRNAASKPTKLAFHIESHSRIFLEGVGFVLAGAIVVGVIAGLLDRRYRRPVLALLVCATAYAAPLLFGVQEHTTNVKGYLGISMFLLVVAAAGGSEALFASRRLPFAIAVLVVAMTTLGGTARSIFFHGGRTVPGVMGVNVEWGRAEPTAGLRTAGYLLRTHAPRDAEHLLAFEIQLNPARYYFGSEGCNPAGDDWIRRDRSSRNPCWATADVVVVGPEQRAMVERYGRWRLKTEVRRAGAPILWIFATPEREFPATVADVETYDARYDRRFLPPVRFY